LSLLLNSSIKTTKYEIRFKPKGCINVVSAFLVSSKPLRYDGAGKSSYFKILNEIVGGNQKKEILSNIYLDETFA
jgi:hypothetical protein